MMLRLYRAQFTRFHRCRQQVLQSQQGGAIHIGELDWLHPATDAGIEHPLRNFQIRKPFELIAHALENNTAAPACLATNQQSLPMPRVPVVLYLSKAGFMGVSYLGCTITTVRIAYSTDPPRTTLVPGSSKTLLQNTAPCV